MASNPYIKIEAITNMKPPTSPKEVRKFIGVINYHQNMWPRHLYTLVPSTILTYSKKKFKWMQVEQYAFKVTKRIVALNTLLTYPDFNETFKIHTNASAFQLGPVIIQKEKHMNFYSEKITDSQQQYKLIDKELISIVETLKEFKTILLGQKLIIYSDHKSFTCKYLNIDRVLRWKLILEQYDQDIKYKKGEKNIVAGAIS